MLLSWLSSKWMPRNLAHSPAPITLFWLMKGQPLFDEKLSGWDRLSHIAIAMVGTSVANERIFSTMKYVTEQRRSLTMHSELTCVLQSRLCLVSAVLRWTKSARCGWRCRRSESEYDGCKLNRNCGYQHMCAGGANIFEDLLINVWALSTALLNVYC